MEINYSHIGKHIREERIAAGLTQAALADLIDKSPQMLCLIENGSKKASLKTVVQIANALGITVDKLLGANVTSYQPAFDFEFRELLDESTGYERRIIIEVATALQHSLKDNSWIRKDK